MCKFVKAIERNWPDYIIASGAVHDCYECTGGDDVDPNDDNALQTYNEGGFSWAECDSCGSRLGGNRYNSHAIHKEAFGPNAKQPSNVHHVDICDDCLSFHANGDTPENWEG